MLDEEERFRVIRRVVAYRLNRYILQTGISKSELARRSKLGRSVIWRILNCKDNPRLLTLCKLETTLASYYTEKINLTPFIKEKVVEVGRR